MILIQYPYIVRWLKNHVSNPAATIERLRFFGTSDHHNDSRDVSGIWPILSFVNMNRQVFPHIFPLFCPKNDSFGLPGDLLPGLGGRGIRSSAESR